MKNRQKKRLTSDLCLLLILLAALIQMTVAWFVHQRQSQVESTAMRAVDLLNAGLSLDDKNYTDTEEPIVPQLPDTLKMQPVTGDGVHLYLPRTDPYTGQVMTDSLGNWIVSTPTAGKDYYVLDIYARADQRAALSLEPGSAVTAAAVENRLLGENISGEYVAGIVRVAFVDVTNPDQKQLLAIWIPNNRYQITGSRDMGWSFNKQGEAETDWQYYDGTSVQKLADLGIACADYFDKDSQVQQQTLLSLTERAENQDYPWWAHLQVVVWLEGMDRDAYAPQMGGNVGLELKFKLEPVPAAAGEGQ